MLRGITGAKRLPSIATPSDNGVTSSNKRSCVVSALAWLVKTAAWTAAPYATASSGLMDLFNVRPSKYSETSFWILGILVDPPTNTNLVNLALLHFRIFQDLLDWVERAFEESAVQIFETGTGNCRRKVNTLFKRVELNYGLSDGRKCSFGPLACCPQTPQCSVVVSDIELALALEFLLEVVPPRCCPKSSPPK